MMQIRQCTNEDLLQVAQMERDFFSEPWTLQGFQETLEHQRHVFLVAEQDKTLVGYGILYCNGDEGEIPTIAIAQETRGCGMGTALLRSLLERGEQAGVRHVFLEVRKSNEAAKRLYQRAGFTVVGQRRGFYRKPTEDAFIMAFHKEDIC